MLLHRLGLKSTPHLPCSFHCQKTVENAGRYSDLARRAGFKEEFDWLAALLSSPMEWSSLHGIVEIRTPVFKVCLDTDATAGKHVIQLLNREAVEDGAAGVSFPYDRREGK